MNSERIAVAYRNACIAEIEALKPGNVHIFADGHRLTVHDFIKSAEVTATIIAQPDLTVGERIFQSVKATQEAVSTNTNLGIILLCAPLINAALHDNQVAANVSYTIQQRLDYTLSQLTIEDAALTAQAIVLANPAGLGGSEVNDVHQITKVNLFELMASAQHKDRIAWQYANHFADILEFGLTRYSQAMAQWQDITNNRRQNRTWATTALYLSFLARQLDSHVVRKHGETLAKQLMQEALEMEALYWAADNPKLVEKHLLAWDASLKSRNINPGTSADLTVACLMVSNFDEIV